MAASAAVSAAATKKPIDMVVTQPSTGKVLAVVERPGGFDRALAGIFPPGSTFKVVTASGLAKKGMTPSSTVQCPSTADLGGRTFHNDANEHLGTTNLQTAFAVSCNTTFAMLASQRLGGPRWPRWRARSASTPAPTWASRPRWATSARRTSRSTWPRTRSARAPTWSTRSARPPWRRPSRTAPGGRRCW